MDRRNHSFENICIYNLLDGLREGLSHFSPPSRAALIYALQPDDPVRIFDPQNLLRGHEPKLKELLIDSEEWRKNGLTKTLKYLHTINLEPYQLSGLIVYGCRSRPVFFKLWFTEHHPDMCSTGPTIRWLEYAASLFSQNIESETVISIGTSGYVLQECANHAVRDYIVDQRNMAVGWDTSLRVFPILDAVLGLSKTVEEGAWPRGELIFVEPARIHQLNFLVHFSQKERPSLKNMKHVRKLLLATEQSKRTLVSNGSDIIGIASGDLPSSTIRAQFSGDYGFLYLDDELICSFADGKYQSSNRTANLVQVEEALLEFHLDDTIRHALFQFTTHIVRHAGDGRYGCTIVLDLNQPPGKISGMSLEVPLDLTDPDLLDLATSLAKVDGALHIGVNLKLLGFACLLDGHAVPGENRSRGARYNSALRFTSEHSDLIVVVVSADRPVSVIQSGIERTAQCDWTPMSPRITSPPTLTEWLDG